MPEALRLLWVGGPEACVDVAPAGAAPAALADAIVRAVPSLGDALPLLLGSEVDLVVLTAEHLDVASAVERIRAAAPEVGVAVFGAGDAAGAAAAPALPDVEYVPAGERAAAELERCARHARERRRLARALADREARLHLLLECEPECVTLLAPDGRVLEVNPAGLAILEADGLEQVVGRPLQELVAPVDRPRLEALLEQLRRGEPGTVECQIVGRRGTLRWIETRAAPLRDGPGEPSGFFAVSRDVTARRQAEQALRESEEKFRTLFEQSSIPAYILSRDGRLLHLNRAGLDLLGLCREDLPRVRFSDLYPDPDERARLARALDAKGSLRDHDIRLRRPDGTCIDCLLGASVLRAPDGTVLGYHGLLRDVTARKRAERELLQRARQQAGVAELGQRALTDTPLPELIQEAVLLVHDVLGTELVAVLERLPEPDTWLLRWGVGWDPGVVGHERVHGGAASAAGLELLAAAPLVTGDPAVDHRLPPSPLLERHGAVAGLAVLLHGRTGAFGILSAHAREPRSFSADDVHFLRSVANTLSAAIHREQAAVEQRRLLEVLEATTDFVEMARLDGRILYRNRAARAMLGITDETSNHGPDLFATHPPESAAILREVAIPAALRHGTWSGEVSFLAAGGRQIPASQVLIAHRTPDGTTLLSTISRDVSDQKELEERLGRAQRLEAIGRLAGGVAHDFNNLLTAIKGHAELMLEEIAANDPAHDDLIEIRRAADRAAELTRQLLAFSRQQVMQPRVMDLNAAVLSIEAMVGRLIGEDIEFRTSLAPDLAAVRADPGQIEQVLMNLVVNARDAMPTGGTLLIETANAYLDEEYVRRHAGVLEPGAYVLLTVSDTGIGMSREVQEKIFEPFFTTKEPGKGTGLGLASVYGIVKQSGGHIWVYSEPGKGTTFKVYLPHADTVRDEAPVRTAPAGEIPGGRETVLVVEDEQVVRATVRRALQRHGYAVLEAANGTEALRINALYEDPIHILVTDVVMPEMSGRELASRLCTVRPEMRVLYTSGYTEDAIVRRGFLEPGIHFLEKPFTAEALARKVRDVLDSARTPPA